MVRNAVLHIITYFEEDREPEVFIQDYLDKNGSRVKTCKSIFAAGFLYEILEKKK